MAVWPVSLPPPALNTVSESPAKNTMRSNMDKGPPKKRRRTTANTYPLSFMLWLEPADLETLKTFYNDDTFSGSEDFSFTHPLTGDALTCCFAEDGLSWQEREGCLVYAVSVALEVQP